MERKNNPAFWLVVVTLIVLLSHGYILFSINQINRELDSIDSRLWLMKERQEIIAEQVGIDTGKFGIGSLAWPKGWVPR